MSAHRFTHTRILQLVAIPSPRWAVFYDKKNAADPLFAQPIHCFALVEQWENSFSLSNAPTEDDAPYQCIRPVVNYGDEMEPIDATNFIDVVCVWPLSPVDTAALLAAARA